MSEKHPHSELIDAVGAKVVRTHFDMKNIQRLHQWRVRGIPYAMRGEFAKLAAIHGAPIPADFFAAPGLATDAAA